MAPVTQVGEGKLRFFVDPDDGNSFWTPSPGELDGWLDTLREKQTQYKKQLEAIKGSDKSEKALHMFNDMKKQQEAEKEAKVRDIRDKSWVVRIHPDTGQVYYANTVTEENCWFNPLVNLESFAKIFAENWAHWEEARAAELEQLAGFDAIVDRNMNGEAAFTAERLESWLKREEIELSDERALGIKWAEYADPARRFNEREDVQIWVNVQSFHTPQNNVRIRGTLGMTVRELHDFVFRRVTRADGTFFIDPDWHKDNDNNTIYTKYAFKVVGCSDYLLHQDYKLGKFDHVVSCIARQLQIQLLLIQLTESDQQDIEKLFQSEVELKKDRATRRKNHLDDDWLADRNAEVTASKKVSVAWDAYDSFALSDINWNLRVMVKGISNFPLLPPEFDHPRDDRKVAVQMAVCHNAEVIGLGPESELFWAKLPATRPQPLRAGTLDQEWPKEWMSTFLKVKHIPYSARICFRLVLTGGKKTTVIAGVSIPLIDYKRELVRGSLRLALWPSEELQRSRDKDIQDGEKDPMFLQLENRPMGENPEKNAGILHITFDSYELPIIAERPSYKDYTNRLLMPAMDTSSLGASFYPDSKQMAALEQIERRSPLYKLNDEEKDLLFKTRDWIADERPSLLPKLLLAIDWMNPIMVEEIRMKMVRAEPLISDEYSMLPLLDIKYSDPVVREFAVRIIDRMNDAKLSTVLLQLTQVLKYERDHDSPLARMLLRRAIHNPMVLGQPFFWMLRSEMHVQSINVRYGILCKLYLMRCGPHKTLLTRQLHINEKLTEIARAVHHVPKKKYNEFVQKELRKLELPPQFSLCHAPKVELTSIVVDKCKVMTSKKLPLRLDFAFADPLAHGTFRALFKCGDDLRQDLLTLQVLGTMERLWIEKGLEPRMIPYACCSAGDQLGFIEWVTESETTAHVQVTYGGKYGALKNTNMRAYLSEHNKGDFDLAVDNFIKSCASYSVATYVLGIGDRHSDNIMVKNNGMLFHIDFGHFLGNFKKKFGVQRERDPFVFTPDFCFVMGKAAPTKRVGLLGGNVVDPEGKFAQFCQRFGQAYNVLRENKDLLISLFILMVPAGMPELTTREDVRFLENKLCLHLSDEKALTHCEQEIVQALNTVSRRLDNLAHTLKHG